MANAEVGDDVYRDDPTVKELEQVSAQMLGKEAALFVPTGTFGNELAVFTHCERGDEVIVGEDNHLVGSEQGGMAIIAGVQVRALPTVKGVMDIEKVEAVIRKYEDIHYPRTGLISIENAHSSTRVLPLSHMEDIHDLAEDYGIPVHLDGARLFNAAVALGVEAKVIAKYVDTVMFCLSKGLCAPIGSMLVGSEEFIAKARRKAKLLGGGMRQVGVLAAPGLIAVNEMTKRLAEDHKNAKLLASLISFTPCVEVEPEDVEINMFYINIHHPLMTINKFVAAMRERGFLINGARGGTSIRLCTHNDVSEADVCAAAAAIRELLRFDPSDMLK